MLCNETAEDERIEVSAARTAQTGLRGTLKTVIAQHVLAARVVAGMANTVQRGPASRSVRPADENPPSRHCETRAKGASHARHYY